MNPLGRQLLSGPAFAGDQDRVVMSSHPTKDAEHREHHLALAHHGPEGLSEGDLFIQVTLDTEHIGPKTEGLIRVEGRDGPHPFALDVDRTLARAQP